MIRKPLLALSLLAALGAGGWAVLAPAEDNPPQRLEPPGQEMPEPGARDDMEAGRSLVERGAELFLRGLMNEVGPQIEDMQQGLQEAAKELGPKLGQLMDLIDDARNYTAPERLPNGDIIIRRAPGAPPPPPLPGPDDRARQPAPEGPSIDL